jgi:hypothetical protein
VTTVRGVYRGSMLIKCKSATRTPAQPCDSDNDCAAPQVCKNARCAWPDLE